MDRFISFMERKFVPIASKIGAQRHLVSIRDAFMVTMPMMILGALAVAINNLPIDAFQNAMNSIFGEGNWQAFGGSVWNGTFAILSVFIAFLVAYNLAKSYGKEGVSAGAVSLGSFFALGGANGMSSTGLFVALITGIVSAELFVRLIGNEKLVVKMPEGVPPAVAKSFAALFPAMIVVSLFGLFAAILAGLFGIPDIITSFYEAVQKPFMGLANTYPSALLIAFITPFLWFFGLHGANMIDPFMQTINVDAIEKNIAAIAAGDPAPYIVNKPFIDSFVNLGGTGATIGLIIAIYLVGRKSKAYMVVNNLSAGPGLFNINEPMLFGLPIVLNPIMFFPFVLVPMVLVTVAYFATKSGIVPPATFIAPWTTPPIIGGFLTTQSVAGGVLAAVNVLISTVIYMPFVKISTLQQVKREEEAEAEAK